jgi:cellulose synthase/poly-beta-1,6-N-acetylglucosamine synthase-like glycosyltransferase
MSVDEQVIRGSVDVNVSIIMPAHNSARFIRHSIESVRKQGYRRWELIVIDDGSTDETPDLIRQFSRVDARIKGLRFSNNRGPAAARNAGIQKARGRFIAFLDSDDSWYPDKLEMQLRYFTETNAVMLFSDYDVVKGEESGVVRTVRGPDQVAYSDLLKGDPIGCLTAIYDTARVGKMYMPAIRMRQDWGLWIRILRAGGHAHRVPDTLATLRLHEGSLSAKKLKAIYYNFKVLRTEGRLGAVGAACGTATHLVGAMRRRVIA